MFFAVLYEKKLNGFLKSAATSSNKKTAGKPVFLRVCLQSEMTTESQGTINSFEIYAISTHFQ